MLPIYISSKDLGSVSIHFTRQDADVTLIFKNGNDNEKENYDVNLFKNV